MLLLEVVSEKVRGVRDAGHEVRSTEDMENEEYRKCRVHNLRAISPITFY